MNLIDEIIGKMTVPEKARLVCGISSFGISGVPSFNISGINPLDGGTGINYEQLIGDIFSRLRNEIGDAENEMLPKPSEERHVIDNYFQKEKLSEREQGFRELASHELNARFARNTSKPKNSIYEAAAMEGRSSDEMSPGCFPTGMMLGATWNPDILYAVGKALGREARAYGIHMLLGTPNINIHRDPLNGRLFEGFSEDPMLVSMLAPKLVAGVQSEKVAANIKHFAANNQETNRWGIDEIISERTLNEIYFPGFKACVKEGKAATVMAAYNKINGVACTENKWLLTDVLRNSWGFEGMVVSDWGAVYNRIEALKAGTDLNMPGPVDISPVVMAIEDGSLDMEVLDKSAGHVLSLILEYGMPEKYDEACNYIMEMSKQAAYKAACEGIVMLKNERNIFPITNGGIDGSDSVFADLQSVCGSSEVVLCGSGAFSLFDCGTGSAGITTDRTSDIYSCLREQGIRVSRGNPDAYNASDVSVYICIARIAGMEGNDRADMYLNNDDKDVLDRLVQIKRQNPSVKLALILNVCGPVDIRRWENELDGIFCIFLPGMEGGRAMADILTGRVNPSGKLPLTFPKKYADTPTSINFPGDGYRVTYGEGIYVGYRYYDKKELEPMYPFGFGLSYSRFEISNIHCNKEFVPVELVSDKGIITNTRMPVTNGAIRIYVDITNTGGRIISEGQEVVQLYINDECSSISKPIKELKAFNKVRLSPGETVTVEFNLSLLDFASYDEDLHEWIAEEGIYNILVGTSSRDIKETMKIYLDIKSPYSYGVNTTIKRLYEDVVARSHLFALFDKLGFDIGHVMNRYEYEPSCTLDRLLRDIYKGDYPVSAPLMEFLSRISSIKRA